jgi:hypothetical protein
MSDSILGCTVSKDADGNILKREFSFLIEFEDHPDLTITVPVEASEQEDVEDMAEAKTLACTKASTVKSAYIVAYGTVTSTDDSCNGPVIL